MKISIPTSSMITRITHSADPGWSSAATTYPWLATPPRARTVPEAIPSLAPERRAPRPARRCSSTPTRPAPPQSIRRGTRRLRGDRSLARFLMDVDSSNRVSASGDTSPSG